MNLLLGIKLDDQLFVHRRRLHVFAARQSDDARFEILAVDIEPRGDALALREVARFEHHGVVAHLVLQSDKVGDFFHNGITFSDSLSLKLQL